MQDSKSVWRLNSSLRPSARALEKMDFCLRGMTDSTSGHDGLSDESDGPSVRNDGSNVENYGLCVGLSWTVFLKYRSVSWSDHEYEC